MNDEIAEALDNNDCAIGIFLDFSQALDTLDHSFLLNKCSFVDAEHSITLIWRLPDGTSWIFYI